MKTKYSVVSAIVIILITGLLFFTGGTSQKNLNPKDFSDLINSEEVYLVNTHTPYMGEIEGTDLIAEDWDNMQSYSSQLPEDKSTPIAVYCRSGSMASTSAQQLIEMGYENVYNLEGGMNAWENSGKNIITK